MRAPSFWDKKGTLAFALYPFSILYTICYKLRCLCSSEYKARTSVICVGNVNLGGSGKTPISIKIGKILKDNNIKFAYLTRGYKGSIEELTKVDKKAHTVFDVGDEALILAEIADTFVAKDKKLALEIIDQKYDYDYVIIDDGLQNPTFSKKKSILIFDGEYGLGNNFIFPAGPLREKLDYAIKRVNFAVIIGQDKMFLEDYILSYGKDVIRAEMIAEDIKNKASKYIAFAGIGRPDKFYNTLEKNNFNVVEKISFSDHYFFKSGDIDNLFQKAKNLDAKLITTKKDWVRFSEEDRKKIEFLDIDIKFFNERAFKELILNE